MARERKIRSDCNYIIYEMRDQRGESYVGLTRKTQSTVFKSIDQRWRRHLSRARNENRSWALYVYLKSGGIDQSWEYRVLDIVRGRGAAYIREREIIKDRCPTLNQQYL
jgi:hypothetical protein